MKGEKMKYIRDNEKISRDIEKAYHDKKYIVAHKSVYQPFYSVNGGYYAREVYYNQQISIVGVGRFAHMTGDRVNHLIGLELLNNL